MARDSGLYGALFASHVDGKKSDCLGKRIVFSVALIARVLKKIIQIKPTTRYKVARDSGLHDALFVLHLDGLNFFFQRKADEFASLP
jgi:hypothetical protein